LPDVPPVILEIPQDTTRAVTNLVFTGTLAKFHDIRFIFSHAGGDVPMVGQLLKNPHSTQDLGIRWSPGG
ncbi:MAG: hypothetical protein WAK48_31530, partial [Candidatus Acidiferrum sp.]